MFGEHEKIISFTSINIAIIGKESIVTTAIKAKPKYLAKSPILYNINRMLVEVVDDKGLWRFCGSTLLHYFDISNNIIELQFFAYRRPSNKRIKIEWDENKGVILIEGRDLYIDYYTELEIKKIMDRLKLYTLYIEVEYE